MITRREGFGPAIFSLVIFTGVLSLVLFGIPWRENIRLLGLAFMGLSVIPLVLLYIFGRHPLSVLADVVFGITDTGAIVIVAIIGAKTFGLMGAVIGAVVGDSVADGIAGMFEGKVAQFLRVRGIYKSRTALSCSMGKAGGCLFGAGVALMIMGEVL